MDTDSRYKGSELLGSGVKGLRPLRLVLFVSLVEWVGLNRTN
jgi:hypothetical protein